MQKFRSEVSAQLLAVNVTMLFILLSVAGLSIMTVWDYRALTSISAYPQLAPGYAQSIAAAIAVTAIVTWKVKQM